MWHTTQKYVSRKSARADEDVTRALVRLLYYLVSSSHADRPSCFPPNRQRWSRPRVLVLRRNVLLSVSVYLYTPSALVLKAGDWLITVHWSAPTFKTSFDNYRVQYTDIYTLTCQQHVPRQQHARSRPTLLGGEHDRLHECYYCCCSGDVALKSTCGVHKTLNSQKLPKQETSRDGTA